MRRCGRRPRCRRCCSSPRSDSHLAEQGLALRRVRSPTARQVRRAMKSVAAMKVSSTHGSWRWPAAAHSFLVEHEGSLPRNSAGVRMPIRRRSAGQRRADVGNCSSCLGPGRPCRPWRLDGHGRHLTTSACCCGSARRPGLRVRTARRRGAQRRWSQEIGFSGNQLDAGAGAAEALDGDLVAQPRDDDLAVLRVLVFCTASRSPSMMPASRMLMPRT